MARKLFADCYETVGNDIPIKSQTLQSDIPSRILAVLFDKYLRSFLATGKVKFGDW